VAKLVFIDQGQTREITLDNARQLFTIGRSGECDLRLANQSLSRKHAEFRFDPARGLWAIADLGSSNGTWVNGRRIEVDKLRHGDELLCGEVRFHFVDEAAQRRAGEASPASATGAEPRPRTTGPISAGLAPSRPAPSRTASLGTDEPTPNPAPPHVTAAVPPPPPPTPPPPPRIPTPAPLPSPLRSQPPTPVETSMPSEHLRRERDTLQDQVRALTLEVQALRSDLEKAPDPARVAALEAEARGLGSERDGLFERLRAMGLRYDSSEADAESARRAAETARASLAEVAAERDAALAEAAVAVADRDRIGAELARANELRGAAEAEAEELRSDLSTLRQRLAEFDSPSDASADETTAETGALARRTIESLEHENAELRTRLRTVEARANELEAHELPRLESRAGELRRAYDDLAGELRALIDVNRALRTEVERLGRIAAQRPPAH
jgi:pSer/pThr/pTyr-binding forkhead associated (FHA) protein